MLQLNNEVQFVNFFGRFTVLQQRSVDNGTYLQMWYCVVQSYERLNLADALVPKTYEDGDLIIKQGDVADGMYFVEAGTIKITIFNEEGKEIQVSCWHSLTTFVNHTDETPIEETLLK